MTAHGTRRETEDGPGLCRRFPRPCTLFLYYLYMIIYFYYYVRHTGTRFSRESLCMRGRGRGRIRAYTGGRPFAACCAYLGCAALECRRS